MIKIKCASCGYKPNEQKNFSEYEHLPCPKCSSQCWNLVLIQSDTLEVKDRHKMKLKGVERATSGRAARELIQGHDLYRKTGKWNYLYRLIDRKNDCYHERITDPRTGKTIRECLEPLSKHIHRGSAKRE